MRVIIVGAGFAGLGAASVLFPKCDVTIIEGNDYIGGRAKTATLPDTKLELGCTFLHGSKRNALYSLATLHHVIEEQHHHLARTVNLLSNGEKLSEVTIDRYRDLFYEVQKETVQCSRANDWTFTLDGRGAATLCPLPPSRTDLSDYLAARLLEISGDASRARSPP